MTNMSDVSCEAGDLDNCGANWMKHSECQMRVVSSVGKVDIYEKSAHVT